MSFEQVVHYARHNRINVACYLFNTMLIVAWVVWSICYITHLPQFWQLPSQSSTALMRRIYLIALPIKYSALLLGMYAWVFRYQVRKHS